jgi:hypothetical protein
MCGPPSTELRTILHAAGIVESTEVVCHHAFSRAKDSCHFVVLEPWATNTAIEYAFGKSEKIAVSARLADAG